MEIIESDTFLSRITKLIDDLELWELEEYVALNPIAGAVIPGSRGLRKLRWAIPGKARGKRGGMRIIYYYVVDESVFCSTRIQKTKRKICLHLRWLA